MEAGGGVVVKIVHVIPSLATGGAERVLVDVALDQVARGHRVEVLTLDAETSFGRELTAGGVIVRDFRGLGRGAVSGALALVRLAVACVTLRSDAVVGWLYHGALLSGIAGRRAGRRFASLHHRDPKDPGVKRSTFVVFRSVAAMSRRFDGAVYVSAQSRDNHEAAGLRTPGHVIPVGVDTSRFSLVGRQERAEARAALGLEGDVPVVAHVARVHPDKGQEVLCEAAFELHQAGNPAVVLVAGSGWSADNPDLLDLAAGPDGLRPLRLLGEVADPRPVLAAADVFCLSSHTEALPVSLIEAMCSGVVPVVTDVGACADAIAGHGFVVAPRDPAALAAALDEALAAVAADPGRRERARAHAVSTFDSSAMCAGYDTLLGD